MTYEYRVTSHHIQPTFEDYLNQNAAMGWEPILFSYNASQTGQRGGYSCVMRKEKPTEIS